MGTIDDWKPSGKPEGIRRAVMDVEDFYSSCSLCQRRYGGHDSDCPNRPHFNDTPASDRSVSRRDNEGPVISDGGSSTYYFLPKGATELNDLIEHKEMSFARGNIFKALYRLGEKAGTDVEYDLNKIELFLERLREMHKKGGRL